MADDLQSLLDRIQKDGVDKAQAEARQIVESAKAQAVRLLAEAQAQASQIRKTAEEQAAQTQERSISALRQAARDVVLGLQETLAETLQRLAVRKIESALTTETLQALLVEVVRAYFHSPNPQPIELLVPAAQQQQLTAYFMAQFHDALAQGLTLQGDRSLLAGFKVSIVANHVEHDFTPVALAEAFSRLLRPQLGEIVRAAFKSKSPSASA
jgi:V/A-type H+-transporting ATPase subunit E